MQTHTNVEDYLEIIAGFRDPITGKLNQNNWIFGADPAINLARYDVDVISNMATHTVNNGSLTERQAELACKLVLKYQRQLTKLGLDVTPVKEPSWRLPLRKMDYSRSIAVVGECLHVKFPFNTLLIDEFRRFTQESQGSSLWVSDQKLWRTDITEYNVSWVYTWARHHDFEVDDAVRQLFDSIQTCENTPYAIKLILTDQVLDIVNAPSELREYIQTNLGGFQLDNIVRLIDYSSILGYTVDQDLAQAVVLEYGDRFYSLLANRELRMLSENADPTANLDDVLDYADSTQRWPVVLFEPDLFGTMRKKLSERYPAELIGTTYDDSMPVGPETKYIHAVKSPRIRKDTKIPLLITTAGLIFGGDRQLMVQNAEKVVYASHEVYTKGHTGKKVKSIAG